MAIDNALFDIRMSLWRQHSIAETDKIMDPLDYYIRTGRASAAFEKLIIGATKRQKSTIARRLEKHYLGSYDDAINSICQYLGYQRSVC